MTVRYINDPLWKILKTVLSTVRFIISLIRPTGVLWCSGPMAGGGDTENGIVFSTDAE